MFTVLLAGGTGFIGHELGIELAQRGYRIKTLVRRPMTQAEIPFPCEIVQWKKNYEIDTATLDDVDILVNLTGNSVAKTRWDTAGIQEIYESRTGPAAGLVRAVSRSGRPITWLQASAVGFYGDRGTETLDENAEAGHGILADVCRAWEDCVRELDTQHVRLCLFRIGPVLGLEGGALSDIDAIYSAGFGANLGSGRHYFSWIHVDDLTAMMLFVIENKQLKGVFNAVSPNPVPYREFHETLLKVKDVLGFFPAPEQFLRILLGKKSEFLFNSLRCVPTAALKGGFKFKYASLLDALKEIYAPQRKPRVRWLIRKQWLPVSVDRAWNFFADERNLEKITPEFLHFKVLKKSCQILGPGTTINYSLRLHGIPLGWQSVITDWNPPLSFSDEQTRGPYSFWRHEHILRPVAGGTLMVDRIQYLLRGGILGSQLTGPLVRRDVERIFAFRRSAIEKELINKV